MLEAMTEDEVANAKQELRRDFKELTAHEKSVIFAILTVQAYCRDKLHLVKFSSVAQHVANGFLTREDLI